FSHPRVGPRRPGWWLDDGFRGVKGMWERASDIAVFCPALAGAAVEYAVAGEHGAGGKRFLARQPRVDRREVRTRGLEQLLEALDSEVGLLVGIAPVAGAPDPLEVEADPVRRVALQAVHALAARGHDAAAVDAQLPVFADQAELVGVPVQPGQEL